MDETSAYVDPSRKRAVNTERIKYSSKGPTMMNVFGFMALNGKDVVMASAKAKAVDFVSFLEAVRDANGNRATTMILDNAMIHKSALVREAAEKLNIKLVFLPPYSPDLNPIEFGWKDMKRNSLCSRLRPSSLFERNNSIGPLQ